MQLYGIIKLIIVYINSRINKDFYPQKLKDLPGYKPKNQPFNSKKQFKIKNKVKPR